MSNVVNENRGKERVRTLLAGTVRFNRGLSTVSCQVRDLTETGAKLTVDPKVLIPDEFEFQVAKRGLAVQAQVRWRSRDVLGVAFAQPATEETESQLVQRLQEENATLRRRIADLVKRLDSYGESETGAY